MQKYMTDQCSGNFLVANMSSLYLFIVLLICFSPTGCLSAVSLKNQFRSDYKYHESIKGWLKLHIIPATWQDAVELCFLEGAVLASPSSEVMKSAISLEMKNTVPDCGIYTGMHSVFSKGYFHSLEGMPLDKMPLEWMPDEPDNAENNESCIAFVANGSIADVNCSEVLPFACYKKKTDDMTLMPCGTPDKAYQYVAKTGSCYKFHNHPVKWREAFRVCSAEGAYLAIINSREEASVVKDLFDVHFPKGSRSFVTHMGFLDWNKDGVFRTVHGQTLEEAGYSDWESHQPDYAAPGEYCGAMFRNAKLDDFWCDNLAIFLCEKDPESLM